MALTQNQLSTQFQSQIGREPTDYEVSQYSTASPQTLASLGSTYANYDTNSLAGYMQANGLNTETAQELADKYGIQGVGTMEGNAALLAALKSGQSPDQTAPVSGTIATPQQTTPIKEPNQTNDPTVNANTGSSAQNPVQSNSDSTETPNSQFNQVDSNGNYTPGSGQTVGGSISAAAGSSSPSTDPVSLAQENVNQAYQAMQETQKQIASIDATLASVKSERMASIAAEGGVVDEAALTSEIYAENQPLLAQRAALASTYTAANQAYQKSVTDYNDVVNQSKTTAELAQGQEKIDNQASQFNQKEQDVANRLTQSGWKVEKTNITDSAGNVLGQQLTAINPVSGEVQSFDSNGNITASSSGTPTGSPDAVGTTAASVNNVSGIKSNGSFTPYASTQASFQATVSQIQAYQNGTGPAGIDGSSSLSDMVNMWETGNKNGAGVSMGYTPQDVANKLGVTTSTPISQIDPTKLASAIASFETGYNSATDSFAGSTPENPPTPQLATIADGATPAQVLVSLTTGAPALIKGSTTPIDQQTLYNAAIDLMMGVPSTAGSRIPAAGAFLVQNKKTDIMNAYGLTEADVNVAKAEFKGMTAANTDVLARAAFTNAAAYSANQALQNALTASASVPRGGAKIVNNFAQWYAGNYTPAGPLAQLETYIYTAAREYAKVTSGGAASSAGLTDTASAKADALLSAAQSPAAFKATITAMQNDMKNVTDGLNSQTSAFPTAVKALYGIATEDPSSDSSDSSSSFTPRGSMSASDFVSNTFSALYPGKSEQDIIKKYTPMLKSGQQLAFDNSTGEIVGATASEIASGDYTPL